MYEELFLVFNSGTKSHSQINKCDRSNFETQGLDIVFEKNRKTSETVGFVFGKRCGIAAVAAIYPGI